MTASRVVMNTCSNSPQGSPAQVGGSRSQRQTSRLAALVVFVRIHPGWPYRLRRRRPRTLESKFASGTFIVAEQFGDAVQLIA